MEGFNYYTSPNYINPPRHKREISVTSVSGARSQALAFRLIAGILKVMNEAASLPSVALQTLLTSVARSREGLVKVRCTCGQILAETRGPGVIELRLPCRRCNVYIRGWWRDGQPLAIIPDGPIVQPATRTSSPHPIRRIQRPVDSDAAAG